jgi:hypothetical protein
MSLKQSIIQYGLLGILFVTFSCNSVKMNKGMGPAKVKLTQVDGRYLLTVNGKPFYVKGAGLEFGNIEALGKHGANSFRTWRTDNGQEDAKVILDRAQKNGLMVLMGLEVGRERHGYNYDDTAWVKKQFETLQSEVIRLKDHPALLGWAIGNELNLQAENLKVYDAVNDLSKMIHRIDPNHVTTTTMAGIGKREVDYVKEHCTDIDFLSIQMYGDIVNLHQRITEAGWEGPYMVTEWGSTGHWEVPLTEWKAPIEPTSTEKAKAFLDRYKIAIASDSIKCLGSYVFLWGQKQERTPTWYGMFTENGEETETVDAMHYIWNGSWPENRCPSIESFILNTKTAYQSIKIAKNEKIHASVVASDYDNDTLAYKWVILHESTDLGMGGDFESKPDSVISIISTSDVILDKPKISGAYRLFVYVLDGKNHAATANIPFYVEQ